MLGIVYLVLAILLGKEITEGLLFKEAKREAGNRLWLLMPASFGVGALLLTWAVYAGSWLAGACAGAEQPLLWGNLVAMGLAFGVLVITNWKRWKQGRAETGGKLISDWGLCRRELVFFGILLVFITWIMFYVFHIRQGVLYSGFTVYGDYAPHTAMLRSFSWGSNFPTQYPHYGGADVKYHFMFQFLAGNLEYLGMRMDFAYNIISILALLGLLMMVYMLARRIAGGFAAGLLTVVFFLFRSGLSFFRFVWEHLAAGDLWKTLAENTSFIGYTTNEDWGLWNFNVYLNQRHLAFGLLLAAVAVWVYLDWLEAGTAREEKGLAWLRGRFFTKEAWKSRSLDTALMVGLLLGLCAFWNGAAVIGGLLILLGFGLFSDGKVDYAVTAAVAVGFALLQSRIFIAGEAVSPSFCFGFLAQDKSLTGILWYLFQISGFFFVGLPVLFAFLKRRERAILIGFLFPAVFAFVISLTPDINVNHKYVMISYAFLAIFWAWAVVRIFSRRRAGKAAAVLLVFCLTANGLYDFAVILKGNDAGHRVAVDMESPLSFWLRDHLGKNDLLLTPEYSMNDVTMSGVMLYCGWPYYAWSAGYDTNYRAARAVEIYTASDAQTLKAAVNAERITYILFEEGMEFEQNQCREDVIAQTYPMVYNSEDGRIRIYET